MTMHIYQAYYNATIFVSEQNAKKLSVSVVRFLCAKLNFMYKENAHILFVADNIQSIHRFVQLIEDVKFRDSNGFVVGEKSEFMDIHDLDDIIDFSKDPPA